MCVCTSGLLSRLLFVCVFLVVLLTTEHSKNEKNIHIIQYGRAAADDTRVLCIIVCVCGCTPVFLQERRESSEQEAEDDFSFGERRRRMTSRAVPLSPNRGR